MWMRLVGTLQSARCHLHHRWTMLSNPQVKLCWLDLFVCLACFRPEGLLTRLESRNRKSLQHAAWGHDLLPADVQFSSWEQGTPRTSCRNYRKKIELLELEVHRVIAMDLADVTWSNAEMSMKSTFMMRLTHELLDNVPNFPPFVFHMVWCRKPTEHE